MKDVDVGAMGEDVAYKIEDIVIKDVRDVLEIS